MSISDMASDEDDDMDDRAQLKAAYDVCSDGSTSDDGRVMNRAMACSDGSTSDDYDDGLVAASLSREKGDEKLAVAVAAAVDGIVEQDDDEKPAAAVAQAVDDIFEQDGDDKRAAAAVAAAVDGIAEQDDDEKRAAARSALQPSQQPLMASLSKMTTRSALQPSQQPLMMPSLRKMTTRSALQPSQQSMTWLSKAESTTRDIGQRLRQHSPLWPLRKSPMALTKRGASSGSLGELMHRMICCLTWSIGKGSTRGERSV